MHYFSLLNNFMRKREGSVSESIHLTRGSGFGRPKKHQDPHPQHWFYLFKYIVSLIAAVLFFCYTTLSYLIVNTGTGSVNKLPPRGCRWSAPTARGAQLWTRVPSRRHQDDSHRALRLSRQSRSVLWSYVPGTFHITWTYYGNFKDSKAKCRHLKKLTCYETLWQVFILSVWGPLPSFDPIPIRV